MYSIDRKDLQKFQSANQVKNKFNHPTGCGLERNPKFENKHIGSGHAIFP